LSTLQEALVVAPITTAGQADDKPAGDPRKEALRLIRTALRKADATDDEYEQALEALVELSKD
jgi:transcription initiation factor IIE alpha subunit